MQSHHGIAHTRIPDGDVIHRGNGGTIDIGKKNFFDSLLQSGIYHLIPVRVEIRKVEMCMGVDEVGLKIQDVRFKI
jgi:hypothetical protein